MLKKINPSFKLIGIMLITLSYTVTQSLKLNLIFVVSLFLLLLLESVSLIRIIKTLIPVSIAAFGFFMTALIFSSNTNTEHLTTHMITDIEYAYLLASRVFVFALLGMLFTYTTKPMDLMYSLRDQLKIPDQFIYGIFATVNLLPVIKLEVKKNQLAFQARNQKVFPYSSKVLIPLFTKVILYSDHLTQAMLSKDFGKSDTRSYYKKMTLSTRDYIFIVLALSLSISLITYAIR